MTEDHLRKLRGHYHSLSKQSQRFKETCLIRDFRISRQEFRILADELRALEADFPGVLPPFKDEDFVSDYAHQYSYHPIQSYLAVALGKLQSLLDDQESTPVTQVREFTFIKDLKLRSILERDYQEIQRAFIARCWKSLIILCGGAIEAILVDLLVQNQTKATTASNAPKEPDISKWRLSHLINVSVELSLVTPGAEKLSHSIREYRNLIHPGNEIRHNLMFDAEEARIALEVLHIIHRDLSP
jgi:hypothetical protein